MTHYLRLRHRLLPYLHTMNHRAAREGTPLVQPMYWSYPKETDAYQVPNQFTFGTELVVVPITTPKDAGTQLGAVRAWLPEGTWVDVFTGLVYDGGRQVVLHRQLSDIPVLARAGAIVPFSGDPKPGNSTENPHGFEVLVVIGADGEFTILEDDGGGSGLEPESVASTRISFDQQTGTVSVEPASGALSCIPGHRSWEVTFLGLEPGTQPAVTLDGAPLDSAFSCDASRISVSVSDISVGSTLRVTVGPNPAIAANDVSGRLFALLDRAHIGYEAKRQIHTIATSDRPLAVRLSHLQALALARPLETAVGEILLARDTP
jgi:hypothetical protein